MPYVTVNKSEYHLLDEGAGAPLLLVHGFPLDQTMWRYQIEHFSDNYRVIAPDLRGFGRSDLAMGTVSMMDYAADLAGLLDVLNISEPIIFCGLSMGGYIGWQFVERYADRLKGLILCDTKAAADTEVAAKGRLQMTERVLSEGADFVAETMSVKLFSETTRLEAPHIIDQLREVIRQTSPASIAAALKGMAARPDMTAALAEISLPTLLICGAEDLLTPPTEMQRVAASIPHAHYAEVPQAGHMSPLEQPEQVNEIIESFLKSAALQS